VLHGRVGDPAATRPLTAPYKAPAVIRSLTSEHTSISAFRKQYSRVAIARIAEQWRAAISHPTQGRRLFAARTRGGPNLATLR
jgi:hypothetical protein